MPDESADSTSTSSGAVGDTSAEGVGTLSRRRLLEGAGAAAAGALSTLAMPALGQGRTVQNAQDVNPHPGVRRINKTYRALVRRGNDGPAKIEKVTVDSLVGRQVLVRCTAEHCCYTDVGSALGPFNFGFAQWPQILGHEGLGVVEEVGPEVSSLKPGDKVFISVTTQCGRCYNCIRGRADSCLANLLPAPIIGKLEDGTPISQGGGGGGIAGISEYTINYEERLMPYFSDLPDTEVALLVCVGSTGLGMTSTLHPIESGATVVVFGAGPVGLSAIQGARIQGATKIVAVEPIAMRRQVALKVGATDAVDPNQYGDQLVEHLRQMVRGPTDRIFAGGQSAAANAFFASSGPDYVIEAMGRQQYTPKAEQGPDPTGLQGLRQVWDLIPLAGWGMTCGVGYHRDDFLKLPAGLFTNGAKTLCACQQGGSQPRRDTPRYLRLLEQGKFDAKSMITNVYRFDDWKKAYQEVADRTVIANVLTFG